MVQVGESYGIFLLMAAGTMLVYLSLAPGTPRLTVTLGIAGVQLLSLPGWIVLFSRWHELYGLAPLLAFLVDAFGVDAAAQDGRVVMNVGELSHEYLPSLGRLAAMPIALSLTGLGALLILSPVGAWSMGTDRYAVRH